jgi:hypothetical protein
LSVSSVIGSVRMRFPVAAKIALHTAGAAGGSAGSPSPVGGADDVLRYELASEWLPHTVGWLQQ